MPDLIETVEDGVAILTLNRPENLNALSDEIRPGLVEAFHRLGSGLTSAAWMHFVTRTACSSE